MGRRAASEAIAELAFALELLGDKAPFSLDAKAISGLAWAIRSAPSSSSSSMIHLPGMSPVVLGVIDDALADRPSPTLQDLRRTLPEGLFALRRIKGLGPKKVSALWRELGIESPGELEYACRENRLTTLDGFGEKTQTAILEQLQVIAAEAGLMRRDAAEAIAAPVLKALRAQGARAELAGGWRRGQELVDEVVVVSTQEAKHEASQPLPQRLRLVVSDPSTFGAALIRATGSDAHVSALVDRAAAAGLQFDDIKSEEEAGVYAALGLVPTDPEQREGHVLMVAGSPRPTLITVAAIKGALHNHTTASDGADDLPTMLAAAKAFGLQWFGISDHSVAASYAGGLDGKRLAQQRKEIGTAGGDVVCFTGIESDILAEGQLDLADADLEPCDVVIASMHQRYGLRGSAQTARLVRAARHPLVDIVGHPTGRLLLSRAPAEFDVSALIEACAETGTALELNANPARLDLAERWLREAKARGVMISIAADAHAASELSNLHHGVAVARRAGLEEGDVLNTMSADALRQWVAHRRQRAQEAS
jgi:DNA polymerase (family 10)